MSSENVINSKKSYPKIYYEMILQRKLRKLVEHVDAIKPCRNGRILCLECYQRNCICLEKTVQRTLNWKMTESRPKVDNLKRENEGGNDGYDDEFNFYSSLIIPPASLLLRYTRAEQICDMASLLAARELMKRMKKISKLNVHAWLQFLGDIDKDDNFSDNTTPLSDEEFLIIIKKNINNNPIKRPSKGTDTGDKDDNKKMIKTNEKKDENNNPVEINDKEKKDENNNPTEVNTEDIQQ